MNMCEMDGNAIMSEGLRDRTAGEIIKAYQKFVKRLRKAGIRPKKHLLANKCAEEYKQAIIDNGMQYELVPKGQHRRNIAEKAIQTWKAHVDGVFSGMSDKCPLAIWDLLLPQIDMQVNLLRQSNIASKVSAWAYMHGQHYFNRHPLVPLRIEAHIYIPPDKHKTWGVKSHKGFYIGTSFEHYRYYKAYCTSTKAV